MSGWIDIKDELPEENKLVTIRVRGKERPDYYRLYDRWYSLEDLDRWRMNTSRYWPEDRTWYLKTEQVRIPSIGQQGALKLRPQNHDP